MQEVKFVSYDGDYPQLCKGRLVLRINTINWIFPYGSLGTGGGCEIDGKTSKGEWRIIKWPKGFPEEYKYEANKLVNEKIVHGCCGGCS